MKGIAAQLTGFAQGCLSRVKSEASGDRKQKKGKSDATSARPWWLQRAEEVLGPLPVEFVDGDARSILLLSAPQQPVARLRTRGRERKERIFDHYDKDNDGMLNFDELAQLAADVHTEFHPTAPRIDGHALEEKVAEILLQIEVHQDHCVGRWFGTVEFDEFESWLDAQEMKYLQKHPRPAAPARPSYLRFDGLRSRMNLSRWRRLAKPFLPSLVSGAGNADAAPARKLPRSRSHDDLLGARDEERDAPPGAKVLVRSRSEDHLGREAGRIEDKETGHMLSEYWPRLPSMSPRASRNADLARPASRSEARSRLSPCTKSQSRALADQLQSSVQCLAVPLLECKRGDVPNGSSSTSVAVDGGREAASPAPAARSMDEREGGGTVLVESSSLPKTPGQECPSRGRASVAKASVGLAGALYLVLGNIYVSSSKWDTAACYPLRANHIDLSPLPTPCLGALGLGGRPGVLRRHGLRHREGRWTLRCPRAPASC